MSDSEARTVLSLAPDAIEMITTLAEQEPGDDEYGLYIVDEASIEALVIGSERGLCGAFNSSLIQFADPVLDEYADAGQTVRLAVLGSRAQRSLERIGRAPDAFRALILLRDAVG